MNKTVFEFSDYKVYLRSRIENSPKKGRGVKLSLASFLECPPSHISQVLNGNSHFTLEQAEELNSFLHHTDEESYFFILLVQYSRAGTKKLENRIKINMQKALEKHLNLKERLNIKTEISISDQMTFYSSWLYGAAHVIVSIPEYQSINTIADKLNVSTKKALEIVNFLVSIGLILQTKSGYKIGSSHIHLGSDSPMISKFHTNWRMKAIQSFDKEDQQRNLHYSSVVTLSKEDFLKIKSLLVRHIDEVKGVIRESKEEILGSFCLDFYEL